MRYRWARSALGETASLRSGAQQCRGLSRLTGLPAPQQRYQYRSLGVGTDTGTASSRHEAEPLRTRQLFAPVWCCLGRCYCLRARLLALIGSGRGTHALKNLLFAKSAADNNPG